MKQEKLSEAITNINLKYVEEAADYTVHFTKKKSTHYFRTFISIAACFCVVIGGFYLWKQLQLDNGITPDKPISQDEAPSISENGITIPKRKLNLAQNDTIEADMIGFFIYQGRSYVQYDYYLENASALIGEYLGTSNGLIDEWTEADGYVEGAGSISGDFYSVKGYDSSFMLCMKAENDTIHIFINDNGITLQYGSELFHDRLHLNGDYESLSYQTREAWYYGYGNDETILLLEEDHRPLMQEFLTTLNLSEFVLVDTIPLNDANSSIYDEREIYHLYFTQEDGMMIHLRLFDGGYVMLQGLHQVCVQVEPEIFDNLIQVFEK